jgi:hypothetical protein
MHQNRRHSLYSNCRSHATYNSLSSHYDNYCKSLRSFNDTIKSFLPSNIVKKALETTYTIHDIIQRVWLDSPNNAQDLLMNN